MLRAAISLLLLSSLLLSPPAQAKPDDTIKRLYNEAKADLNEGRYSFALESFKRALTLAAEQDALVDVWRTTLGVALTYQYMEQPEHTIEYFRRFVDSTDRNRDRLPEKWAKRRTLVRNQIAELEEEMLRKYARIALDSDPSGARVMVDGKVPGADGDATSPFALYLKPGSYTVRLELEGYEATEVPLKVTAGSRETVNVPLYAMSRPGTLTVTTGDEGAEVFLDGTLMGAGATVTFQAAPGAHVVRVRHPGHEPVERTLHVTEGGNATLRVDPPVVSPKGADGEVSGDADGGFRLRPLWGWIGAGGGVAFIGTAAVFTVLAQKDANDLATLKQDIADGKLAAGPSTSKRWNDLSSGAESKQTVAGVFYGLGGAAIAGAAVYVFVFADLDDGLFARARGSSVPGIALVPQPGGGALSLRWTW
jgi:tetratricopeptide (TPR) repeat protein